MDHLNATVRVRFCAGGCGRRRAVIAVALLVAHPGNPRGDLAVDEEFLASVRELGILTPLRVTPDGSRYRVIEGHQRLAAAIGAGLDQVPCDQEAPPFRGCPTAGRPPQRVAFWARGAGRLGEAAGRSVSIIGSQTASAAAA
jgi:hypothetical protein